MTNIEHMINVLKNYKFAIYSSKFTVYFYPDENKLGIPKVLFLNCYNSLVLRSYPKQNNIPVHRFVEWDLTKKGFGRLSALMRVRCNELFSQWKQDNENKESSP